MIKYATPEGMGLVRLSAPVHTSPGALQAFSTMGIKQQGIGVDHQQLVTKLKKN
jgi:hypothetical protein